MIFAKKFLITNKQEYLVPLLASISLIISCIIISSKKFFWNDELYSYYLLSDPSFSHMLGAFHDKINNTPALYFILGWLWARLFGSTELSLRLFSSVGMCLACMIVWITLRRTYSFWSTSIGTLSVFCTSGLILSQNSEARMYGLFMFLCSLALWQFDQNNCHGKVSKSMLFSNFFIHAAILHTHLFGLFYSTAILCSQIFVDARFKISRYKLYLSIVLSWLSLIFYLPSFLVQADAGKPRTWIPTPLLKDLINFFNPSSELFFISFVLFLLVIISVLHFLISPIVIAQEKSYPSHQAEFSLLIFAFIFLLVPIFVWIISRTVKPIFWDRYLIPTTLSWSIFLAYLTSRLIPKFTANQSIYYEESKLFRYSRLIFPSFIVIILLLYPLRYAKNYQTRILPGSTDNTYGYQNLPIAVQVGGVFLERRFYSNERDRYFFILDKEASLDNASGQFSPQEYKHLEAIKRQYPKLFNNNIINSEDFLKKYSKFLVIDFIDYKQKCPIKAMGIEKGQKWEDLQCPQWLEKRILDNPNYKVTPLGGIGESWLLVERKNK